MFKKSFVLVSMLVCGSVLADSDHGQSGGMGGAGGAGGMGGMGGMGGAGGLGGSALSNATSNASATSSATANANQGQLQGQLQGQIQGQGQGQTSSNSNSQSFSNSVHAPNQAPALLMGSLFPTAPCQAVIGGGFSMIFGGGALAGSRTLDQCEIREAARIAHGVGQVDMAKEIICMGEYAAKTSQCAAFRKEEVAN
jgi:hypothetical protein